MNASTGAGSGLPPEQRDALERAKRRFREGAVDDALASLTELHAIVPDDADLTYTYGVVLLASGEAGRAREVLASAAQRYPEDARVQFGLGRACHASDPGAAEAAYRRCLDHRPGMSEARLNLAQLLRAAGRAAEALSVVDEGLARAPELAALRMVRGLVRQDLGELATAEQDLAAVARARPELIAAWNNLGNLRTRRGREEEALQAFDEGLGRAPRHFELLVNRGVALHNLGRLDEAMASFEQALSVRPEAAEALGAMGETLMAKLLPAEAEAVFRRALESEPDALGARRKYAQALLELDRPEEAIGLLRATVASQPQDLEAAALLADTFERLNREEEARAVLAEYAEHPGRSRHPGFRLVGARLKRREGELEAAIEDLGSALGEELPTGWRRVFHYELGRLNERRRDTDAAFRHFREANRLAEAFWRAGHGPGPNPYLRDRRQDLAGLTAEAVAAWTDLPAQVRGPAPIFLVGFPRSGTTLLDQILDAHPALGVMEERPALRRVVDRLEDLGAGDRIRALGALDADTREQLRATYWDVARFEGADPERGRVVDKMPLSSTQAHVIQRVFPDSPLILVVRHPCDAVLSCFMQEFGFNAGMANFYSLESAVDLYETTMSLWHRSVELFDFDFHRIRYEDLVADPGSEARSLLDYLGLDWDPAVLEHAEHARNRGRINTPSYHQVSQPIYHHAAFRWERYRSYLEPVLDRLAPWVVGFGYPDPREPGGG